MPLIAVFVALIAGAGLYVYVMHRQIPILPWQTATSTPSVSQTEPGSGAKPTQKDTAQWLSINSFPGSWPYGDPYSPPGYTVQGGAVYSLDRPVIGADLGTFVVSTYADYAKDKKSVYFGDQTVVGADPATFISLDNTYSLDRSHVFCSGKILTDADPATFQIVPSPMPSDTSRMSYGKDKSHVYDICQRIPQADPQSFRILSPLVPVDKNWIYGNAAVVGPISLMTSNAQYATELPTACISRENPIQPFVYPRLFSRDLSVIGYTSDSATCVINKKSGRIQLINYGAEQGAQLSSDGTKLFYSKYQSEGAAINGETCAACGTYSVDLATYKSPTTSSSKGLESVVLPSTCKIIDSSNTARWLLDCGYTDDARGTINTILTGQGWRYCNHGPITESWWKNGVRINTSERSSPQDPIQLSEQQASSSECYWND